MRMLTYGYTYSDHLVVNSQIYFCVSTQPNPKLLVVAGEGLNSHSYRGRALYQG